MVDMEKIKEIIVDTKLAAKYGLRYMHYFEKFDDEILQYLQDCGYRILNVGNGNKERTVIGW